MMSNFSRPKDKYSTKILLTSTPKPINCERLSCNDYDRLKYVLKKLVLNQYYFLQTQRNFIYFYLLWEQKKELSYFFHTVTWAQHYDGVILYVDDPIRLLVDNAPCFSLAQERIIIAIMQKRLLNKFGLLHE